MIRVGILGLGKMGKLHFLNAVRMKRVEVVAVADKLKRNRKFAENYHIKAFEDYEELLEKGNLDAVIISLPNFLKHESIVHAAEKNISVFVDKPLARGFNEAQNTIAKVRSYGSRLMVGVNYRYIDSIQKLKQAVQSYHVGDVVISVGELIMDGPFSHPLTPKPVPEWWFDRKLSGGGAILDLGYHLIDIFQWMFGDLSVLYSRIQHRYNLPIEDTATILFKANTNSTTVMINVGWFSRILFPNFNFRVTLHGTSGYIGTTQLDPKSLYIHAIKKGGLNILKRLIGREIDRLSYTYYYASFTKILQVFFYITTRRYCFSNLFRQSASSHEIN
jgi:predicted dehydrogenase